MWELWVNLDYDHLCISLSYTSKAKYSHKLTFFLGITTLFLLSLLLLQVKISEKKISFPGLKSLDHRLVNREKLTLPLEKYFKTLKDMIISTVST